MHTHLENARIKSHVYVQHPAKWISLVKEIKTTTAPALIILPVSFYYSVSIEDMKSKTRMRPIVVARQMSFYMLRRFTELSLHDIGKLFGDRDHTTVIHGLNTIRDLASTDKRIDRDITILTEKIKDYIS